MKKIVLVFFILIPYMPIYSMNNLLISLDPSRDEKERGLVGSLVRKLLKNSGMFNEDLIGLGSPTERTRTLKIWADLTQNPGDPHLQKQFCDRQGMASSMALSLIAQLEELCPDDKKNKKEEENKKEDLSSSKSDKETKPSSVPIIQESSRVPISQESARAFELIELSVALRKLHAHKSLSHEQTIRLIKATNKMRQQIKKRLCIEDGKDVRQNAILKEEPLFDEEVLQNASATQTFPRKVVLIQAIKLLQEAPTNHDPEEEQLTQQFINLALQCAPENELFKQADISAQKRNCDLVLQKKALPSSDDDNPPPPGDDD